MKVVPLKGHEMSPSILDLTINPNVVQLKIRFSIEAMLAEIDLSEFSDTNLSENATNMTSFVISHQIKLKIYLATGGQSFPKILS